MYIGYLRRKTEGGGEARLIQTVRGVGYVMREGLVSLRARLTLLAASAVAVAIALAAGIAYVTVQNRLFDEADRTLQEQARRVVGFSVGPGEAPFGGQPGPTPFPRTTDQFVQIVGGDGTISVPGDQTVTLPVDDADEQLADRGAGMTIRNVSADGEHLRMITIATGAGTVVQIAKPLGEIDNTLASLRITLIVVALGGIALAGRRSVSSSPGSSCVPSSA